MFSRSLSRSLKVFKVNGQQYPHILLLTELISRSTIHQYRTVIPTSSARIKQSPTPMAVRSSAAQLLGSRVRILFVNFVSCVLCSYRPLRRADDSLTGILPNTCLIVCDLETSTMTWLDPIGLLRHRICYVHSFSLRRCRTICLFRGYCKQLCSSQPTTPFCKVQSNLFLYRWVIS